MSTALQLQTKGIHYFQQQEYDAAIKTFQEALTAYEAEGNPIGAAEQQVNIGLCHRALDQPELAIAKMEAGLAVFREKQDTLREAQALGNLALVYAKQDNTEQATTHYRQAAQLFRQLGEDEFYGQTIMALADMQFKSGQILQAAETFEIALDYIENPNQRQKIMKQLLVVKNRFMGTNLPPKEAGKPRALRSEASDEDDE